eukprot:1159622-Pelagomonas_calceolata.AAC.15
MKHRADPSRTCTARPKVTVGSMEQHEQEGNIMQCTWTHSGRAFREMAQQQNGHTQEGKSLEKWHLHVDTPRKGI